MKAISSNYVAANIKRPSKVCKCGTGNEGVLQITTLRRLQGRGELRNVAGNPDKLTEGRDRHYEETHEAGSAFIKVIKVEDIEMGVEASF